ncbi:MAG: hypothetical protein HOV77_14700 [Hamadaea sp.]|uniref:hypothetical protein n=1 Tax=Hamadaea sp. TaxID=2024425 RepID=UPI001848CFD4|nr:hypothetical protein [Hamadaea sp.]NUT20432.1 hypothetical protein [Hamadaea sp.]
MLTAVVMDSDVAMLVGWDGGRERFRWLFNEESGPAYGLSGRTEEPDRDVSAGERRPVVEAILWWAARSSIDADRRVVDDILSSGYVFAEEGLFALLAHMGVIEPGGRLIPAEQPKDVSIDVERLRRPDPYPLDVVGGDEVGLPGQPAVMFLAAAIEHGDAGWADFVVEHELERWGSPSCLVVSSSDEVAAGGLTSHGTWNVILGSDPAVSLFSWRGSLGGAEGFMPIAGPWHVVPAEYDDVHSAVVWARSNVGECRRPPSPDRERLEARASGPFGVGAPSRVAMSRAGDPNLVCQLYTYVDLMQRRDALAAWLDKARRLLAAPVIAAYGHRACYPSGYDSGLPYGVAARVRMKSARGRWSHIGADTTGWDRTMTRLRAGELHFLQLELEQLNGKGMYSRYRGGVTIEVELRDQFTDPSGPIPDGHPATIVIKIARSLIAILGGDGLSEVRRLVHDATTSFGVASGFMHAVTPGDTAESQYERRNLVQWRGERLDSMTRGVYWGNLIGAGHLTRLAGIGRLQDMLATRRIERLDQWSAEPPLWWFELHADPFAACDDRADAIAHELKELVPGDS